MQNQVEETFELTQREIEILQYSADGLQNRHIAECVGTTEQTIKNARRVIMEKTDSHTITHSVAIALRKGIIK